MSTLRLKIREGCEERYIEFYVDGENLATRIKASLGEGGCVDEVLPWYGIDYTIEETVLGESVRRQGGSRVILFACGCGCAACSSVFVDVAVSGDTLTLANFITWRDAIAPIDPILFDRAQFDHAVQQLEREIATWQPPPPKIEAPRRVLVTPPSRQSKPSDMTSQ